MWKSLFTICLLLPLSPGISIACSLPDRAKIAEVAQYLEGEMDTTAQAVQNPKIASVRMTTCRINSDSNTDSVYLYQEQALIDKLDKPYRQRVLELKLSPDNKAVESKSYRLQQQENFINFCNKDLTERRLKNVDLAESVCTVILKRMELGYRGETPPGGCPTTARGAVRITNTILLHPDGMDTSDRGFDANGRQVWGARDNYYEFRRSKN